jgi:hypothetical protein
MKPVYQKITEIGKGDCWRACIASILELDIDSVPNFVGEMNPLVGPTHYDTCKEWLRSRGLFMLDISLNNDMEWFYFINWTMVEDAYAIASVPSQKNQGGWHSVVIKFEKTCPKSTRLVIIHDPRKDNEKYPEDVKIRRLQFISNIVPQCLDNSKI